uniref:Nucleolar protein 56 n=1 Tax=Wuchereria bancrofti TaxID=6293 RepID=A0A1I8EKC0_WUCBA
MGDVPQCVLYEHAVGYVLFRVAEFEDIGTSIPQVEESIADLQRFRSIVKVGAFEPFKNTESALENCNSLSEGHLHPDLLNFLEANLPRKKKKVVTLAVGDSRLASAISEQITGIKCQISGVVPELMRGIRIHFEHLVKDLPHHSLSKAQLSLGHEVLEDNDKVVEIVEAARTSMGMDISDLDLFNVLRFAKRVDELTVYRQELHTYVKERMHSCAPSLSALIGEQVGARLISHAGSLTNLAKYPASTVQILGAEKALFRALKTRCMFLLFSCTNTPKYGLLFHSSFIGRASAKNKGRISRFLANKCTVASRIDCFSDVPVATYGEHLKQQVEDRLKFLESGIIPKKNLDVMKEAIEEAATVKVKILKKRKKEAKRAKRAAEQQEDFDTTQGSKPDADAMKVEDEIVKEKIKRPKLVLHEEGTDGGQKTNNDESVINNGHKKKKKKESSDVRDESRHGEESGVMNGESSSKKKKKLMKKNDSEITESGDNLLECSEGALPILNEGRDHKKKKKKCSMDCAVAASVKA